MSAGRVTALAMLETLGDDSQRRRLDSRDGFIAVVSMVRHAGQDRYFGELWVAVRRRLQVFA